MRAALAVACILAVGCAPKVTIPAAAFADVATTQYALNNGLSEGNPLWRSASINTMAIAKVAGAAYLVWLCGWLEDRGHTGWAKAVEGMAVGLWGGATAWNVAYVRRNQE